MAKAIDDVREFGDDVRIDRGVEPVGHDEAIDLRLDFARELLDHQMLILHLGAELRGLEQAFAVPHQRVDRGRRGRQRRDVINQPFVEERRSEEHTSELQSLMRISYAVFCLTKKNNSYINYTITPR